MIHPTMQLRWERAVLAEEEEGPCSVPFRAYSDTDRVYVLKQLWVDHDTGEREWRGLDIEDWN